MSTTFTIVAYRDTTFNTKNFPKFQNLIFKLFSQNKHFIFKGNTYNNTCKNENSLKSYGAVCSPLSKKTVPTLQKATVHPVVFSFLNLEFSSNFSVKKTLKNFNSSEFFYLSYLTSKDSPDISAGFSIPKISSIVGARSASLPSLRSLSIPTRIRGTLFVV